ncbi:MAG TPA: hypothetical protein VK386_05790 [Acidimicrobiales bacterium]|nr:hypothetical protein [Acidimicrobiales bacterium]
MSWPASDRILVDHLEDDMIRLPHFRRRLQNNTRVLLCSLGDTPVLIASKLEALGVRAIPRDPDGCAIAVFLHAALAIDPGITSVKVTNKKVVLKTPQHWRRSVHVRLSGPLRRFVESFDAELFPALVRAEVEGRPQAPVPDARFGT